MPRRRRFRVRLLSRAAFIRLGILALVLAVLLCVGYFIMIPMPGESHRGPLPPLTDGEAAAAERLQRDVMTIAGEIGPRSVYQYRSLERAAAWIEDELRAAGYEPTRETFPIEPRDDVDWEVGVSNIIVEVPGSDASAGILIIGAHYDGCGSTPGANDNGSGVAATLELARRFATAQPSRTIRFVFFVNEEPPFFQTEEMGSLVHARGCAERGEAIHAMLSIETIGCYLDEPGTQKYPPPLNFIYPDTGNFIAFVGNIRSRSLVRKCIGVFRETTAFPSEGGAVYGGLPGVGWSDHWSFWEIGVPAIMITDTAPFRYEHYHTIFDTPDKLDYERIARVVGGLERVVHTLAREPAE